MTIQLKPGDRVRCVDARGTNFLDVGCEYEVVAHYRPTETYVRIKGGRVQGGLVEYRVHRFKPIVRVKALTSRVIDITINVSGPPDPAAIARIERAIAASRRHIFADAH